MLNVVGTLLHLKGRWDPLKAVPQGTPQGTEDGHLSFELVVDGGTSRLGRCLLELVLEGDLDGLAAPILHVQAPGDKDFHEAAILLPPLQAGKTQTLIRFPRHERKLVLELRGHGQSVRVARAQVTPVTRAEAALYRAADEAIRLPNDPARLFGLGLKAFLVAKRKPPTWLLREARESFDREQYRRWVEYYGSLSDSDRAGIRARIGRLARKPVFSIVADARGLGETELERLLDSLAYQLYPAWDCVVLARPEDRSEIEGAATRKLGTRSRITIATGWADAAAALKGELTALLAPGSVLAEDGLYLAAEEVLAGPEFDYLYTDRDHLERDGSRSHPELRPDWGRDLFYSGAGGCWGEGIYRTEVLRHGLASGVLDEPNGGWRLVLGVLERSEDSRIAHLPQLAFHSMAPAGLEPIDESTRELLERHLKARGIRASVEPGLGGTQRVVYPLPAPLPKVTAIICTRDRVGLLRGSVEGVLNRTDYPPLELIVVDNGSMQLETLEYFEEIRKDPRVKVIRHDAPFNFSELNNLAVRQSQGELIAFLNNDLEMIHPDWLKELVRHAVRPGVGAVGAKLLYPMGNIQHAGVLLGIGYGAGHVMRFLGREEAGYLGRAAAVQDYSAVTAACLVMKRGIFEQVGEFDEKAFTVAYNDVDLCLRIRKAGYHVIWTPYAELYHLESASRESDEADTHFQRFLAESRAMKSRWKDVLYRDPYSNPNLTLDREDYAPAFPPRAPRPWKELAR